MLLFQIFTSKALYPSSLAGSPDKPCVLFCELWQGFCVIALSFYFYIMGVNLNTADFE